MSLKAGNPKSATIARLTCAVLLAGAMQAGKAQTQLHAVPVTETTPAYVLEGYRVLPPPGKNWFEMQRDRQQALFGKKIDSPTHSFVATATSGPVNEKFDTREQFKDYVNKMRSAELDTARFRIIEFDSSIDNTFDAWCVRYRFKRADRDAVLSRNRALLLEDYGITCLHPQKKELVVDIGYSERGRPAELSADLRQEGETFVRSLEFAGF
ncbi:MAG: hypothetical protein ABIS45_16915 [Burkholderiales bacterium]